MNNLHHIAQLSCRTLPNSPSTDGSNDIGLQKINPGYVKIFDINHSKSATSHFLDMCLTSDKGGAIATCIFSFDKYDILWENCVSLSNR